MKHSCSCSCVSTSIMIYRTYSLVPRRRVRPFYMYSMLGMLCHIRRPTMNLRASENSSETADRLVGFLLVLKFPH